jgi:murein DD-endopeptidase MepM/ murein hydrolase activator NlpD
MVRVRHTSGYVSQYLHLSAFGAGIRPGAAIEQGQTIGRVGASGLATGPHLHYGLQKNGTFVNPLREHRNMPPGDPVPAAELGPFAAVREKAMAIFSAPNSPESVSRAAGSAQ